MSEHPGRREGKMLTELAQEISIGTHSRIKGY
jgi:hypothetical protein